MSSAAANGRGSLSVVGSGIRPGLHLTQEARAQIERADDVLYLLAEVAPTTWIERLNPAAESLRPLYRPGRDRDDVYEEIVEAVLARVRRGRDVCMVTYGHPSVFDDSSHEAVHRATAEGFPARVFPGISSMDCLFADLGIDPGSRGLQLYDATDFLVHRRTPDRAVPLILWQFTVVGQTRTTGTVNREGLRLLADRLEELYGAGHEVVAYEASPFPVGEPMIDRIAVRDLPDAALGGLATLFVPPTTSSSRDPQTLERLAAAVDVHRAR